MANERHRCQLVSEAHCCCWFDVAGITWASAEAAVVSLVCLGVCPCRRGRPKANWIDVVDLAKCEADY